MTSFTIFVNFLHRNSYKCVVFCGPTLNRKKNQQIIGATATESRWRRQANRPLGPPSAGAPWPKLRQTELTGISGFRRLLESRVSEGQGN